MNSTKDNHIETKEQSWFRIWWDESIWPGLGLFGESYLLFSIGTLKPLWELLYPECWLGENNNNNNDNNNGDDWGDEVCSKELLHSLSYNVVMGVIIGMIVIGTLANCVGRRVGSILTASLMAFGALGLSASSLFLANEDDAHRLFRSMSALLFFFGIGVGGEYPLSASSASELALQRKQEREAIERQMTLEQKAYVNLDDHPQNDTKISNNSGTSSSEQSDDYTGNKGRQVIMVFAMQGMGIFVNSLVLTLLLIMTNQMGAKSQQNNDQAQPQDDNVDDYYMDMVDNVNIDGYYDLSKLLWIWRIVYAIGASTLLYVLVSRVKHLEESKVWKEDQQRRKHIIVTEIMMKETRDSSIKFSSVDEDFVPTSLSWESKSPVNRKDALSNRATYGQDNRQSSFYSLTASGFSSIRNLGHILTKSEGSSSKSEIKLLFENFGYRLFGTSMSWFLWDVAFYGNKLFQSSFLLALTGNDATLFELSAASSLNAFIALLGYFAAAFIVDDPRVGRLQLQQYGFLITGTLFILCGFFRKMLPSSLLILLYFGSSFFGQCGPNCTTFLYPAEVFPTEMRTMCHGISASAGKAGALVSAVLFNYLDGRESAMFFICGICTFAASALTLVTLPETSTLDLFELDKQWRLTCAGRKDEYEGPANDPKHLSYYEKMHQ